MAAAPATATSLFPDSPFTDKAVGTTSAAFLKLPVGARAEAMGGAAAGSSSGAESIFRNPAGLARLNAPKATELIMTYSQLLADSYAGGMGLGRRAMGGTVGMGLIYFSQSSLTSYDAQGDVTGEFRPVDLALSLSYARPVENFLIGGSFKGIRSSLAGETGSSVAADVGVQALHVTNVGEGPLDVGAYLSQLGPPLKLGSVSSPLPFQARTGFLWHASERMLGAVDIVLPVDHDPYVALGVELSHRHRQWAGFLRAGYNQARSRGLDGLAEVTAGAGLEFGSFRLDYAWIPFGDLGVTNRVALGFKL
ncbi:MAG: PorV/PorQ family protein [Elusimicrobia bacterium]|nr:PorV/PorQ family protein [Elusimicrobiota bacterium]